MDGYQAQRTWTSAHLSPVDLVRSCWGQMPIARTVWQSEVFRYFLQASVLLSPRCQPADPPSAYPAFKCGIAASGPGAFVRV